MFYVRIKFSHSFHFETNQSKSMSEITTGIVTEIRQRTENILTVFDFMSCATSMFFLFIILRVLNYRYKFLTNERFDNRFITKDFREIDLRRAQMEKETILPLNHRERGLYITVSSVRLIKSEKVKLSKAAIVLGVTTLKLSTHMIADYALYWVLTVIRHHARVQSTVNAPNVVGINIDGEGFLASLLKSIVKAFQPLGVKLEIDTIPCLPDPLPPDYDRYVQIAILLILCWILTIFEPYGLRLRHSVMCYYHPTRARQRAIWLYNHIMRSRSSFLKFARRQLRRKVTGAKGITKVTCKEYLRANIQCKSLLYFLGSDYQEACILCGEVFRENDPVKRIRCAKPACAGIYCRQCFDDLQNLCTVCMEPIQYGDLSDISEEKDSSGEEYSIFKKRKRKRAKKKCTLFKCLKDGGDSDEYDDPEALTKKKKRKRKRKRCIFNFFKRDRDSGNDDDAETNRLVGNETDVTDSDYTSGATTDNSYSYQEKLNMFKNVPTHTTYSMFTFKDIEKQGNPDYASWCTFELDSHDRNVMESSDTTISDDEALIGSSFKQPVALSHDIKISQSKSQDFALFEDISSANRPENSNATECSSDSSFLTDSSIISELRSETSPTSKGISNAERNSQSSSDSSSKATHFSTIPVNTTWKSYKRRKPFSSLASSDKNARSLKMSRKKKKSGKFAFRTSVKVFQVTKTSKVEDSIGQSRKEVELSKDPKSLRSRKDKDKKGKTRHISFSSDEEIFILPEYETSQTVTNPIKQFHQEVVEKLQKEITGSKSARRLSPDSFKIEESTQKPKFTNTQSRYGNVKRHNRRSRKSHKSKFSSETSKHSRCQLYKKTLRFCKKAYQSAKLRKKPARMGKVRKLPTFDRKLTPHASEELIAVTKYTSSSESDDKRKNKLDIGIGISESHTIQYKDESISTRSQVSSKSTSHSSLISELKNQNTSLLQSTKDDVGQSALEIKISENFESFQKSTTKLVHSQPDVGVTAFSTDVTYGSTGSILSSVVTEITSDTDTTFIETPGKNPGQTREDDTEFVVESCMYCNRNTELLKPLENITLNPKWLQGQNLVKTDDVCNYPQAAEAVSKQTNIRDVKVPPLNLNFDSPRPQTRESARFKDRVKYEVVKETPRSISSSIQSPEGSPRSPLNIDYQIYVPHFDKFVTCPPTYKKLEVSEQTDVTRKTEELRHLQRTKRLQDLLRTKRVAQTEEFQYSAKYIKPIISYKETTSHQQTDINRSGAHRRKVKDYYKKINSKQPRDNLSAAPENQNKFVKFIKGIFRKTKGEDASQPLKPKLFIKECDKIVLTKSPTFSDSLSSPSKYSYSTFSTTTSSSADRHLQGGQESAETTTRSSGYSLMGSSLSHTRGGSDSNLEDTDITSSTTTSTTTQTTDNKTKNKNIYLKQIPVSSDSELTDVDIYFGEKKPIVKRTIKVRSPKKTNTLLLENDPVQCDTTLMKSNKCTEDTTPRYSRQPAERDHDPYTSGIRLMKRFLSSPAIQNYTVLYDATTSTSKIMQDNSTSSDMSPSYIDSIKAAHPPPIIDNYVNTNISKENYSSSDQIHYPASYCRGMTKCRRSPIPRCPDDYRMRCASEERMCRGVEYCSRTEGQPSHDYDGPYKSSSNNGCCHPQCKAGTIQDYLPEYSGGEPTKDFKYERCYCRNRIPSGDNHEERYDRNFCNWDNSEVTRNDMDSNKRRMEDESSCHSCSSLSVRTEFPELMYQNTDEFEELVNELGDTLSQRNKLRVRKAMREFECMSSQNKNLERPVFDSDGDEQPTTLRRSKKHHQCHRPCCCCQIEQRTEQISPGVRFTRYRTSKGCSSKCPSACSPNYSPSSGYVNKLVRRMDDHKVHNTLQDPNLQRDRKNVSHWEMDPRTGEWYKVYDGYYDYDEYYQQPVMPPHLEQALIGRSVARCAPRKSAVEQSMSNRSPRVCKCNNCCRESREPMY